ncbi:Murein DD-endopeptidase MepM and murein hydrolase activator NlpD, contain LysM domain [Catalinimonas alkaloidigena]|uniref:Murein DD-endopeptidase MepM and murein hydrolase activator NlpD, contain LysM domain n=1 Tax=Catalinimonas alkaloidigena TaxID=1075417 RepID=A0A1G9KAE5_9BACT|nr:peptidoglycan DD-metalloendopeptidase family protein [Catalinimonas alkaloidigena]SDL46253.1 Murein DD-endopeptidase MepM and murein hydrolase activator NlpD, contain LysM domain [Catalinimonas alkaloidigena]
MRWLVIILLLVTTGSWAQNRPRDFRDVKAPPIKTYTLPDSIAEIGDTTEVVEEELDDAGEASEELQRELSIVSEDTSTIDEGYTGMVEISEELQIDSVWVTLTEYYSVWDSRRINPYDIDATKFRDTVDIELIDTTTSRLWAMPMIRDTTYVTSGFGMRGYRWHYGSDLKLSTGDTVVAAFDGIVRIRSYDPRGYGYYVLVRHYNGLETLYGHMSKILVKVGDLVKAGETLGLGGSTGRSSGPHLHYEVRYQGNAINPEQLYDFSNRQLLYNQFQITNNQFSYLKEVRKLAYHRVRSGDTLSGIAHKYGTSVRTLCRLNRITPRTILRIGQRIRVR